MEGELAGEGGRETRGRADEMVRRRDEGAWKEEDQWEADGRKGLGNQLGL